MHAACQHPHVSHSVSEIEYWGHRRASGHRTPSDSGPAPLFIARLDRRDRQAQAGRLDHKVRVLLESHLGNVADRPTRQDC